MSKYMGKKIRKNDFKCLCTPDSFNTNISHQLLTTQLPLLIHNTRTQIQTVILYSKTGFKSLF